MNVTLKPSLAKFVKQQIKEGRYGSVDDIMAAAISRLMQDEALELAPGELRAMVKESERDFERGDFSTLEDVRQEFVRRATKPGKKRARLIKRR